MSYSWAAANPGDHAGDLAEYLVGVLLGWALTPWLWPAAGPIRMASMAWAITSQEAAYSPTASGDGGHSVGMAQFNDSQVQSGYLDDADRSSPFLSGLRTSQYLGRAIVGTSSQSLADRLLGGLQAVLLLATPGLGYCYARYAWTHGTASVRVGNVFDAVRTCLAEERGTPTWLVVRALSLPLTILSLLYVWKAIRS